MLQNKGGYKLKGTCDLIDVLIDWNERKIESKEVVSAFYDVFRKDVRERILERRKEKQRKKHIKKILRPLMVKQTDDG